VVILNKVKPGHRHQVIVTLQPMWRFSNYRDFYFFDSPSSSVIPDSPDFPDFCAQVFFLFFVFK